MSERIHLTKVLQKYLPEEKAIVAYVADLLSVYPLHFKIVKPRKTKLGDFRWNNLDGKSQITVNGDLNPYSFLITTVHEIAHFFTFERHGRFVKPHGKEWQRIFAELLQNIPQQEQLPNDIRIALQNYSDKPKASSCTDIKLYRVLSRYDKPEEGHARLEHLTIGTDFELNQHPYKIISKARTRYLCISLQTQKKYKVHALAQVKPL